MCIFATQMLNLIKKYPMSILLGVIALQIVNISGKLDESGKLAGDKRACTKFYAHFDQKVDWDNERKRAATKIGIPVSLVRSYCGRLK